MKTAILLLCAAAGVFYLVATDPTDSSDFLTFLQACEQHVPERECRGLWVRHEIGISP